MPISLIQNVAFGGSKAGLTTVGYRLIFQDGTAAGRIADGIIDLGDGEYGATVVFPDGFLGWLKWDTGEGVPRFATAGVDLREAQGDAQISAQVSTLSGQIGTLQDTLTAPGTLHGAPGVVQALTPDAVVRAGLPAVDDCPILTRFKAFVVSQGVCAVLEHVFRDRVTGNPVDLSGWLASGVSASTSTPPAGTVKLRAKEWLGAGYSPLRNPVWEQWGNPVNPAKGVVRARLTPDMVEHAGIYQLNWAVVGEDGRPVVVDRGILSVERSLFPALDATLAGDLGPPTLQEVRTGLKDSSASENLLLDDVEFADDEILTALAEPVRRWNESPPPIETFTTRDFPFRGAWLSGVKAELYKMAAAKYRRNKANMSGGGVQIADLDKEKEYNAEGARLSQEYDDWLIRKKVEWNLRKFSGASLSPYYRRSGW
jgi:hypothetical protein